MNWDEEDKAIECSTIGHSRVILKNARFLYPVHPIHPC
jgi:hypothetical protein